VVDGGNALIDEREVGEVMTRRDELKKEISTTAMNKYSLIGTQEHQQQKRGTSQ
jgi:hypothetical protein